MFDVKTIVNPFGFTSDGVIASAQATANGMFQKPLLAKLAEIDRGTWINIGAVIVAVVVIRLALGKLID